ncbi:hypothetical protein COOONC_00706 [Cooperia oncophora]
MEELEGGADEGALVGDGGSEPTCDRVERTLRLEDGAALLSHVRRLTSFLSWIVKHSENVKHTGQPATTVCATAIRERIQEWGGQTHSNQ